METNNQNLVGQAAEAAQPVTDPAIEQIADLLTELAAADPETAVDHVAALFADYAEVTNRIDEIKQATTLPALEKHADAIKAQIQQWAKDNGECAGAGFVCTLSTRPSWDTKALDGFAAAYPELLKLKSITTVATVKRAKAGKS